MFEFCTYMPKIWTTTSTNQKALFELATFVVSIEEVDKDFYMAEAILNFLGKPTDLLIRWA